MSSIALEVWVAFMKQPDALSGRTPPRPAPPPKLKYISCFSVDLHLKKGQQITELLIMLVNFVSKLILDRSAPTPTVLAESHILLKVSQHY
jgi:hypothetical protein